MVLGECARVGNVLLLLGHGVAVGREGLHSSPLLHDRVLVQSAVVCLMMGLQTPHDE
jgi:hypothetical protein